ncbi:MAG: hypothetical protein ACK56F_03315, partial [bacterium]
MSRKLASSPNCSIASAEFRRAASDSRLARSPGTSADVVHRPSIVRKRAAWKCCACLPQLPEVMSK